MHDLYVKPGLRKKGSASLLFNSVQDWGDNQGTNWLQWNSSETSIGFYTALGYSTIPKEEDSNPFFKIEWDRR
jgi:GNAT superfamily N-acetyltransferase